MSLEILPGDCFKILKEFPPKSVQCVVTSPPYLNLRRYGEDEDEFGQHHTVAAYVQDFADLADLVRDALDDEGVFWLNIDDRSNNSGGAGGDWKGKSGGPGRFRDRGYADGTYLDVPGQVLHALLQRGWRLRREIVWVKPTPGPESLQHVRRPLSQHEKIFLLVPTSGRYRFNPEALETFSDRQGRVERGSVWTFAAGGSGDKHLAPFPDELARRCIELSTAPGDVVLDPFSGSGTTARVADQLGRRGVGIELYSEYQYSS